MGGRRLRVSARSVALRCSESVKAEIDTLGDQIVEGAGHPAPSFSFSLMQSFVQPSLERVLKHKEILGA